jgi:hypothetical protein
MKNEELSVAIVEKLFNGAHHGAEALVEIELFHFLILMFLYFPLILDHQNRKHNRFELN